MKNSIISILIGTLALCTVTVTMSGCNVGVSPDNFHGTWERTCVGGKQRVTISTDKLIFEDFDATGYVVEGLSWTPVKSIKEKDPHNKTHRWCGYKITGKLTSRNGDSYKVFKADESGDEAKIGDIIADWWYFETNNSTLTMGNNVPGSDHGLYLAPFIRQ
jgi:hypothetical protein